MRRTDLKGLIALCRKLRQKKARKKKIIDERSRYMYENKQNKDKMSCKKSDIFGNWMIVERHFVPNGNQNARENQHLAAGTRNLTRLARCGAAARGTRRCVAPTVVAGAAGWQRAQTCRAAEMVAQQAGM